MGAVSPHQYGIDTKQTLLNHIRTEHGEMQPGSLNLFTAPTSFHGFNWLLERVQEVQSAKKQH